MQIADIFEKASGKLPMVPKVVQELVNSFDRADSINIDEISKTVGHDQVLTARILRLANTARFGGSRRIGSLDDALIVLGFDNLRILVIASGIAGANVQVKHFDLKRFWQRCFEIGNTAKALAKLTGDSPQLAFTCGLLARIGELVLHIAVPREAAEIDRQVAQSKDHADRTAIEQAVLGLDANAIGAELANRWSFPENIVAAIGQQHLGEADSTSRLASLVGLSVCMVDEFDQGQEEAQILANISEALLQRLGIRRELISAAMADIKTASTTTDDLI